MNIKQHFEISAEMVEVKNLKIGDKIKVLEEDGVNVTVKVGVVVDISQFTSNENLEEGTVAVQFLLISSDYWRAATFSVVTITEKNQSKYQIRPLDKHTRDVIMKDIDMNLDRKIREKEQELKELQGHREKLTQLDFVQA